jgi:hypothetical protein
MGKFLEYQSNISAFKAPVEAVLSMFYSVNDLWEPARDILYPALGIPVPRKRPRKSVLSKQFLDTFANPSRMKKFFAAAPEKTRAVWEAIAWGDNMPLETLEDQLGFPIAEIVETPRSWRPHPRRLREFAFAVLIDIYAFSGLYDSNQPRRGIVVVLPPKIRSVFRELMPKPKGYHIEPLAAPPDAAFSFRAEATAPDDLRFLAEYIEAGNLKSTKSGKFRIGNLREIQSMIGAGEFFEDPGVSSILPMLRVRLLTGLMDGPGKKTLKYFLDPSGENLPRALRGLLACAFINVPWIHKTLLDYIKGSAAYNKKCLDQIFEMFSHLDTEGWATAENLLTYANFRDLDFNIFSYEDLWVRAMEEGNDEDWYEYRNPREYLYEDIRNFVTIPLVHGMAFLLAAMGYAEIQYNHPSLDTRWVRPGESFLSPFAGLSAMRLTPLGAFAFGKSETVELAASERPPVHLVLNEHRLTLTCRDLDRATEVLLNDFTEKVSDGFYRMTRHSLMRGCKSAEAVAARIGRFKKRIPAEIPPLWEQFLAETAENCVALRERPGYVFYELSDTPELRRLFLSDPLLRKKSIKTAGPGVAVKQSDVSAVSRRLASLGYLMD